MIYLVKNLLGKELVWFKKNGYSSFSFNHPSLITHYSNSIFSLTQNKTHLVSILNHISHIFNSIFFQNCGPHPLTLHSNSLTATRVPFFYTPQWFILSHQKTYLSHLTPIFTKRSSSDPIKTLNSLAFAFVTKAHHLKHPKSKSPLAKTKVFPHSYGGYSISLSFGTPPQTIPFLLNTGINLVWFPCTSRYICTNCNFPNIDPSKIPSFIPKLSSSSKIIGCKTRKCAWI